MSTSSSNVNADTHPLLKSSVLYVARAPRRVRKAQVESVFARCGTVVSVERIGAIWKVELDKLRSAESALATLHGTLIPGFDPPWRLELSHSPDLSSPVPSPSTLPLPQFIKCPPNTTHIVDTLDAQALFAFFRTSGPLVSVRTSVDLGYGKGNGVCVVRYWAEKDAAGADERVVTLINALNSGKGKGQGQGGEARLQVYDPRNIFCANMAKGMTVEKLYKHFEAFADDIVDVRVRFKKPDAPHFGFVVFRSERRAEDAMSLLNNTMLDGRKLSLRFSEKDGLKPVKHPENIFRLPGQAQGPGQASSARPRSDTNSTAGRADARNTDTQATNKSKPKPVHTAEDQKRLQDLQTQFEAAKQRTRSAEAADAAADSTMQRLTALTSELGTLLETHQQKLDETLRTYQKKSEDLAAATRAREEAERREQALRSERGRLEKVLEGCKADVGIARKGLGEAQGEWEAALAALKRTTERKAQAKDQEARVYREWQKAVEEKGPVSREDEIAESIRKLVNLKKAEEAGYGVGGNLKGRKGPGDEEEQLRQKVAREIVRAELVERFGMEYEAALQEAENGDEDVSESDMRQLMVLEDEPEEDEGNDETTAYRRYTEAAAREAMRCRRREETMFPSSTARIRLLWTPSRALERFQRVGDEFEGIRFCDDQPLTVFSIPWPTLLFPDDIRLESIEWGSVEAFFQSVKTLLPGVEYKALVEKTHRRFHPDKWKSRGLLRTILDEELRAKVEAAGNMVAQVVTPLWSASRTEG